MSDKRKEILGSMDIKKSLLKLAIPAIIGMLINAIYNVIDRIFVGKLGTEALAATNVVFPLFALIGAVGLTFGIGAGSYVSRLLGQGNKELAQRAASTAIFSSMMCGFIYTLIGLFFIVPILKFFGASDTAMAYAVDYGKYLTMGAIFTMMNMTMNNLLRSEGSPMMAMLAMLAGALTNIVLDPIFIFVLDMGIAGAAIATVISQMLSTVLLISYYLSGKSSLRINVKLITFSRSLYAQIMKIGTPTFLRQVLASLSLVIVNHAARQFGDSALAGMGIVNIVFLIAFYVLFGFNQGFQPLAGYNYGAKNYKRLGEAIRIAIIWATLYCVIITVIFSVFTTTIVGVFSVDSEVIEIGTKGIRAFSVLLPFMGFIIIITGLYQALGRATGSAVLSLSRQGLFLIPTVLILPRIFGLNGVIYSQLVADFLTLIVASIFTIHIMKKLKHEELDMLKGS
ncbi:MAG: MATE family efflux transporter [Firmicutes bacterium HGW-Firmicutes-1]|nr:MAG: MATE family efflux transporter [Firmicutes bacterium HGW-Firmicutes-1]